jgi:hypothetical protein
MAGSVPRTGIAPRFILLPLILLLAGASALHAQGKVPPEESAYSIRRTESGPLFVQRFNWPANEYVYRYELIIEKRNESGTYTGLRRESVQENYAELSLEPGRYRYRVLVYNLLDQFEYAMDWMEFTVHQALQPEITGFSPRAFFLDEDTRWLISVTGKNLLEGSELYLREGERIIRPSQYSIEEGGNRARLVFNERLLAPGLYRVYVQNPGGLESELGTFSIRYRKAFDLNLSAGLAPLVPAAGFFFDLFGDPFYPLGAYGKANLMFLKRPWGFVGIEAVFSWTALTKTRDDYTAKAQFLNEGFNLVYQKYLLNRIAAFSFRIGGGFTSVVDLHFTYGKGSSASRNSLIPMVNGGLSFMWFIRKPFFVELGVDYVQALSADNPQPGFIRPFAGAGRQF